jgi:hypothetical protein
MSDRATPVAAVGQHSTGDALVALLLSPPQFAENSSAVPKVATAKLVLPRGTKARGNIAKGTEARGSCIIPSCVAGAEPRFGKRVRRASCRGEDEYQIPVADLTEAASPYNSVASATCATTSCIGKGGCGALYTSP